jgi:hypothetical protein
MFHFLSPPVPGPAWSRQDPIFSRPSRASHEFLRKLWSCGFAARCAVGPSPTGGDPSTALRPNSMAGAARTKRAGASWKVEDFPHIRRHSRFGCTIRNPIGQFPTSGGTAASAVQCETQLVNSLHPAAQPLRLYNAKPNWSIPYIRRHSRFGCTIRNPIGQFPTSGGTARSAAQRDTQSVNYLRLLTRRRASRSGGRAAQAMSPNPGLAALPLDVR